MTFYHGTCYIIQADWHFFHKNLWNNLWNFWENFELIRNIWFLENISVNILWLCHWKIVGFYELPRLVPAANRNCLVCPYWEEQCRENVCECEMFFFLHFNYLPPFTWSCLHSTPAAFDKKNIQWNLKLFWIIKSMNLNEWMGFWWVFN